MTGIDDTAQAHDVAVRADDVTADGPVRVDTAMRRCAAMYLGPGEHDMKRLQALDPRRAYPEIGSAAWWRKVRSLAAYLPPAPRARRLTDT